MKSAFIKFTAVLSVLLGNLSFAQQYRTKQIDSIIDVAGETNSVDQRIKLINTAYNASKAINYADGTIRSLVLRAGVSYNTGNYQDAFKLTTKVEDLIKNLNNVLYTTQVATLKAMTYSKLGFYADANQTLFEAIPIAEKVGDNDQRHFSLGSIFLTLAGNNRNVGGSLKTSFEFDQKSYAEFAQINKSSKYAKNMDYATYNLGVGFLSQNQPDSAEFYYKKTAVLAMASNHSAVEVLAFNALGAVFYQKGKFAAAEDYYNKAKAGAIKLRNNYQLKKAYLGLSKVYTALKKNLEAAKYMKLSVELGDSISLMEKKAIQAPLNYIVETKEQKLAASKKKYALIIGLVGALLIIAIGAICFYHRRFRKKLRLNEEQMDELIKKIAVSEDLQSIPKMEELKEIVQLAVDNNPAFILKYNAYDATFSQKLQRKAPSLIATEIEFCVLLRLNFETKEIARYTKTSVRAVEGKKYRVRKKLNIPPGQDINIWMAQI